MAGFKGHAHESPTIDTGRRERVDSALSGASATFGVDRAAPLTPPEGVRTATAAGRRRVRRWASLVDSGQTSGDCPPTRGCKTQPSPWQDVCGVSA